MYPLRDKMVDVMKLLGKRFKCQTHVHPGYIIDQPEAAVDSYANAIRSARIVLTCSSVYRYRLSKYAEIPMCGAALAADMPVDGKDFFESFMITLDPDASVQELAETLAAALPNWPTYAKKGLELTAATSTQEHCAHQFLDAYETCAGSLRPTIKAADIVDGGTLRLDHPDVVASNHCWWLPHLEIKVPFMRDGILCKNIFPREQSGCSVASLALEFTIIRLTLETWPLMSVESFASPMLCYQMGHSKTVPSLGTKSQTQPSFHRDALLMSSRQSGT